jgi:hypothetical protein
VEPPACAVAADEQIEYRSLRRHRAERSIRAGVLSREAGWIDALQSAGRTSGSSSRRVPKGAWANRSSRRTSSSPSSESWSSRLPSSSCAFRRASRCRGGRASGQFRQAGQDGLPSPSLLPFLSGVGRRFWLADREPGHPPSIRRPRGSHEERYLVPRTRLSSRQRDFSKLNAQRSTSRRSAGTIGKSRHDGGR